MRWPTVPLGELVDVQIGKTPARAEPAFWGGGHPWLAISDMGNHLSIGATRETISDLAVQRCGMKQASTGTVLLSFKLSIGKVGRAARPLYTNEAIAALPRRGSAPVDEQFLMWALQSIDLTQGQDRAAMGLTLNKPKLQALEIPLPPLDEQRRIVAILDQADALRRKRGLTVRRIDQLAQAIFQGFFGDPLTNDRGWRDDVLLGDVAEIVSGVTKGRKLASASARVVPYLAVANVQDRYLALDSVRQIEATDAEIARYRLRRNDLLLTEGGDPDKLGRGALWREEIEEAIHQNHVFRVRLQSHLVSPLFLNWLVGSTRGKRYFLRSAKQTTGIASINMGQLKRFPLLTPPIALQESFEQAMAVVERERALIGRDRTRLDTLFASLQHRAFSGELSRSAERELETA